jgi:hypothetical protein
MSIRPLRNLVFLLIILSISTVSFAQNGLGNVGIGTSSPDLSAVLDMVAADKGLLIPRVELTGLTDQVAIANGNTISLLVYNKSNINNIVPGFYFWNGHKWTKISEGNSSMYSGTGVPTSESPKFPTTGDFYIELPNGNLHRFDGDTWKSLMGLSSDSGNLLTLGSDGRYFLNPALIQLAITVENGLYKNQNNAIELGGTLAKPTSIQTSPDNTLAISGLQNGDIIQDEVVTVHPTTGVLKKVNASSLVTINESIHIGEDGQTMFQTPSNINDFKKVHVYRNGVRLTATYINANTIKLEEGVSCLAGDEIRIVQYN